MSIIISGVKTYINQDEDAVIRTALQRLGISGDAVKSAYITKTSIDARRQHEIKLVHSVEIALENEKDEVLLVERKQDSTIKHKEAFVMELKIGDKPLVHPPVVVGFGPAGMFAALLLARNGFRPIVLERGSDVERRVAAVEGFWTKGILDTHSNVQFGEGGAGTFSDGKLTTRINDPRCNFILQEFVGHGAPAEILRKAKPHIGTDHLRGIVKSIREEIIALGGQVRFEEQLLDITIKDGKVTKVTTNNEEIPTELLLLAIGHSARDTFSMLHQNNVALEAKAFSVGVRIEHLQEDIDTGLYGKLAGHKALPVGEYQLSHRIGDKAVYTFCMCPGGVVVPSSSEENSVVTNGMSEFARSGKNANSALAVSVDTKDFGTDWDSGIAFQRKLEQAAFQAGGRNYKAPAQTVDCFLAGKAGLNLGRVTPSYALGVAECDFGTLFPSGLTSMMKIGLTEFSKKINGFSANDVVLTGVETRTSSPVRIMRGEELQAVGVQGLFPCGEGAGYAGGIMSAATDGLRAAEQIIGEYHL